jgi:hypothetical protein
MLKISPLIRYRYCHISTIQNWDFERKVIENSRIAKRKKLFNNLNACFKIKLITFKRLILSGFHVSEFRPEIYYY